MKIGIFDSGLGGLFILKDIVKKLPHYNYIYLADTKNLPYGDKTQKQIYKFTVKALTHLFKNDCKIVIIACNTASARALRKIQRDYLPRYFPDRKVLGFIVPTMEYIADKQIAKLGILATSSTVKSKVYKKELIKIDPKIEIYQKSAPTLVPLLEAGKFTDTTSLIENYVKYFIHKNVNILLLGCTHYPILEDTFKEKSKRNLKILSQNNIIPTKLQNYIKRHPEIAKTLSTQRSIQINLTKITPTYKKLTEQWFGQNINLKSVNL